MMEQASAVPLIDDSLTIALAMMGLHNRDKSKMLQKVVRCQQCGEVISDRRNLVVVGRGLHPLHSQCAAVYAGQFPWYRKPGWPINRWWSFLLFNGLLLALIGVIHGLILPLSTSQWDNFWKIMMVMNVGLLAARLTSYFSLERHVPYLSRDRRSSK